MNTKSIIFFIFIFSYFQVFAQQPDVKKTDRWFRRMQIGYSFISGSGSNIQKTENANGSTTINSVPYSYGKGLNLGYGVGYMFNQSFGMELSLSYFIGGNSKINNFYRVDTVSSPYTIDQSVKSRSNLFRINPSFIFIADMNKLAPYAKIGFILGWGIATTEIKEDVSHYDGTKESGQFEWKYRGANPFGLTSSLGIKTQSKGDLDFFVELSYISMSGSFKSGEKNHHIINGVEHIQDITTSDKKVVFVNEINENSPQDPSKPRQYLKTKQSYDSIGFNLGLIFKM